MIPSFSCLSFKSLSRFACLQTWEFCRVCSWFSSFTVLSPKAQLPLKIVSIPKSIPPARASALKLSLLQSTATALFSYWIKLNQSSDFLTDLSTSGLVSHKVIHPTAVTVALPKPRHLFCLSPQHFSMAAHILKFEAFTVMFICTIWSLSPSPATSGVTVCLLQPR